MRERADGVPEHLRWDALSMQEQRVSDGRGPGFVLRLHRGACDVLLRSSRALIRALDHTEHRYAHVHEHDGSDDDRVPDEQLLRSL